MRTPVPLGVSGLLGLKAVQRRPVHPRHLVVAVLENLRNAAVQRGPALRDDNAKLQQQAPHVVRQTHPVLRQQLPGALRRLHPLLLETLQRRQRQLRPPCRLNNDQRIIGIGLMAIAALRRRLGRNNHHFVTVTPCQSGRVVRRAISFKGLQARLLLRQELGKLLARIGFIGKFAARF